MISDGGNVIAHDLTIAGLLEWAYSCTSIKMVFPTNIPEGRFDLMLTLPQRSEKSAPTGNPETIRLYRPA